MRRAAPTPWRALTAAWLLAGATLAHAASTDVAGSRTLARIARDGVIHVGYIPTPGTFAFQDAHGETVGYSIDLCLSAIDAVKIATKQPDLRIAYRPLEAAQRIPFLKDGTIDIDCGGNTNTVTRQKDVDFSYTFFNTGVRFLAPRTRVIEGPSSLWKLRVAASKGTTAAELVDKLRDSALVTPVPVDTDDEGLALVESGRVDAFAQDDILLYGLVAKSAHRDELGVTGKFLTVEPYAFMLPKDDPAFRALVDGALGTAMRSGELAVTYRKWFETPALQVPMNVYMQENIRFPNHYGIP